MAYENQKNKRIKQEKHFKPVEDPQWMMRSVSSYPMPLFGNLPPKKTPEHPVEWKPDHKETNG